MSLDRCAQLLREATSTQHRIAWTLLQPLNDLLQHHGIPAAETLPALTESITAMVLDPGVQAADNELTLMLHRAAEHHESCCMTESMVTDCAYFHFLLLCAQKAVYRTLLLQRMPVGWSAAS
jgi:hypothetical protein